MRFDDVDIGRLLAKSDQRTFQDSLLPVKSF